jgi:hypothetical protein
MIGVLSSCWSLDQYSPENYQRGGELEFAARGC